MMSAASALTQSLKTTRNGFTTWKCKPGLGKRVRYYQAQIDQETLKKGEDYDDLRESYIIFFCAFDPCGQDRRLYQFHYYEDEDRQLRLATNSHVILINALGTKGRITPELAAIIDVMNRRRDNPNPLAVSLVKEIDGYNQDKKRRRALMNLETRLYDERKLGLEQGVKIGIDQGLTQGRNEGRVEAIQAALTFFKDQGQAPTEVVANLSQMFHLSRQTAQNYYDQLTIK